MDAEIREYLDHLALDRERAPNTVDRYRALLGRFVVFARYEIRRPAVTAQEVDRHMVERFVRHGGVEVGAHAAASTRNVRLAALRGFFGHLQAMDRLHRNPTVGLRSAKVKAHSPGHVSENEFARLPAAVEESASEHYAARDVALTTLMFNCGLRISEALSLDLAQVDLAELRFHQVMRKGRVTDEVVMNRSVADALRRWFLYRSSYKNADESPAVFLSDRGRRLSARAFQRSFRRYVAVAGLADRRLTPHSLRHSCATALIRRGVGIETVADILGHRRLDTTRLYLHLGSQKKLEAVALLDGPGRADSNLNKRRNFGLTRPIPQSKLMSDSARKGSSANLSARLTEASSADAGS